MRQNTDYARFFDAVNEDRRHMRGSALLFGMIAFFAVAFLWAYATELDEVTRGDGRVIPSQHLQEVQSLEGGIVRAVNVRRGDTVEAGQVLLVLDHTLHLSEMNQLRQKQLSLQAEIARLTAEVQGDELVLPEEVHAEAPSVAASQRRVFEGRRLELEAELAVLDQQHLQRQKELAEARSELQTAQRGIALTTNEINLIEPLVRRGVEPEISLLQLQRSQAELHGREDGALLRQERLTIALQEVEERKRSLVERYRGEALRDLSQATADLAETEESMPARRDRVTRAEIRSPVRGVVNRVHATTLGGVAQPGEPLVEVVPLDDTLLVEANIKPSDIAFLHPGQPVKVKLTAYDFARYGSLDGKLTTIGADAIELPNSGDTVYPVQVKVESILTDAAGLPLEIVPGMVAQIDVLTGRRTVLDYITQPVVKLKDTAFRER